MVEGPPRRAEGYRNPDMSSCLKNNPFSRQEVLILRGVHAGKTTAEIVADIGVKHRDRVSKVKQVIRDKVVDVLGISPEQISLGDALQLAIALGINRGFLLEDTNIPKTA